MSTDVYNGDLSPELFTLPHGINEFDLIYKDGYYHLFHTDYSVGNHHTAVRRARDIMSLQNANEYQIISSNTGSSGQYLVPTVIIDSSNNWHVWVGSEIAPGLISHFVSNTYTGTYSFVDNLTTHHGDPTVRLNPYDGKYYLIYSDGIYPWSVGIMVGTDLTNWTDYPMVSSVVGRGSFETDFQADPSMFFIDGKFYISYTGVVGTGPTAVAQCVVAELNPSTLKTKQIGTVIVSPTQPWQQRIAARVQNPVWLENRIYYCQFPYDTDYHPEVATGWGYLEPVVTGRKPVLRQNNKVLKMNGKILVGHS